MINDYRYIFNLISFLFYLFIYLFIFYFLLLFVFFVFFCKCVHVIQTFDIRIYSKNVIIAAQTNNSIFTFSLMIFRRFYLIHDSLSYYNK